MLAMPERSGKSRSCLSARSTRNDSRASAQPLRQRPLASGAGAGSTSAVIFERESKPQRRQRVTSPGMRFVQLGHFFIILISPFFLSATLRPAWRGGNRRLLQRDGEQRVERSEEHTSELQSHVNLVCRLLLEKKNK